MKPFSLFLALRYLQPKRTFVSVITLISVLGVVLGITVMILVISVMKGFELELQEKIIGFEAHVVVRDGGSLEDWKNVAKQVASVPGVEAVAPFTMTQVIAQTKFSDRPAVPFVRGIDPVKESAITNIKKYLVASTTRDKDGKYELDLDGDSCVVGAGLANQLGLKIGDTLSLTSGKNVDEIIQKLDQVEKDGNKDPNVLENIKQLVLPVDLTVTGVFESGRYLYDSNFVLVPLHIGQEMYELPPDTVDGISVKTTNPFTAADTKKAIMQRIGEQHLAITWMDQNKEFFDAINVERGMMFVIMMIIIVVAAFCIMNTLFTFTFLKTREIGVLKALGATTSQVVKVFAYQGMAIGFIGSVVGLGTALLLVQFRNEVRDLLAKVLHIEVFPAAIYQFSKIPAKIVPSDVAIICVSAFVICSIAALIPAFFAARLDPVKALRYE